MNGGTDRTRRPRSPAGRLCCETRGTGNRRPESCRSGAGSCGTGWSGVCSVDATWHIVVVENFGDFRGGRGVALLPGTCGTGHVSKGHGLVGGVSAGLLDRILGRGSRCVLLKILRLSRTGECRPTKSGGRQDSEQFPHSTLPRET